VPKVPKFKSFTAQQLNHLTTQLISSFVVVERLCVFIKVVGLFLDILGIFD